MSGSTKSKLVLPEAGRDHIEGPIDAPYKLVEYGDYQCPYCGQAYPLVKAIQERLGDQLCFAFRNFPLVNSHPHAEHAAEAAEAAGAQDKFWKMHDMLYENQDALEDEDLVRYATELKLDLERFVSELTNGTHTARVREDFRGGARNNVNGTPTFFVNGIRYDGGPDAEELLEALSKNPTG